MGRRNRSSTNSIVALVGDAVYIASRLPWWGALLTGIVFFVLISVVLGGYIESEIAAQATSKFHWLTQARFGRLVDVCEWAGTACFIGGVFFAIRNYILDNPVQRTERGLVTIVSKFLGRYLN